MFKVGNRVCKTEYCSMQFTEQDKIQPDQFQDRGQEAIQRLHQLSAANQTSEHMDPLQNWVKFNETSLKQHKSSLGMFDYTLEKLKSNTMLIPKRQIYVKGKKYGRRDQLRKKLKEATIDGTKANSNCNSVSLKFHYTSENKYERIHSHSVRLDTAGKIKIQPKNHFGGVDNAMAQKEMLLKLKEKTVMSKVLHSKRASKVQNIMYSHKKRASVMTLPETPQSEGHNLHMPNNLAQYKKFLGILNTLRNYQHQTFVNFNSASHQQPSKMKGTYRKSRLSTF